MQRKTVLTACLRANQFCYGRLAGIEPHRERATRATRDRETKGCELANCRIFHLRATSLCYLFGAAMAPVSFETNGKTSFPSQPGRECRTNVAMAKRKLTLQLQDRVSKKRW